jgi:hypothetical protein
MVTNAQTLPESLNNDEEPSVKEHRSTGSAFKKIYGVYFSSGGNCLLTFVILFAFVLVQCCANCIDFFLSSGVNLVQEHDRFKTELEKTNNKIIATMTLFKDHPSGRILNKFSKDCNLPEGLVHCTGISWRAICALGGSLSEKIGRHGFGCKNV